MKFKIPFSLPAPHSPGRSNASAEPGSFNVGRELVEDGKIVQSAQSAEYKKDPEQYQNIQQFIADKH